MLEKIGLPMKPSLRGNVWVVDASHCQGCSSQFTFINRKHHCRRCGGIFCGSCTQQRMFLRGQGDSLVRICEPCKKLEEAARFELRYGSRSRVPKGNSKSISKSESETIHETLDDERQEASSSSLTAQEASVDESNHINSEGDGGSVSPEDLRQKALEEKKKYKVLKAEGKSNEALKAFKRGKELERQADSLEISLRKSRRKALLSQNQEEIQIHGESSRGNKAARTGKDKEDLAAELKELGWSDMDLHNEDNKGKTITLEGEFSSLLGQISEKSTEKSVNAIDRSQVLAHKKKALALKREGLLEEAKEELKKAKVLERRIEEEELLGAADASDDELSALINNMDNDKQESSSASHYHDHDFDLDFDPIDEGKFDVTDEDMEDPEIAAALKSFGWVEEDSDSRENVLQTVLPDKEALSSEILSLKREALSHKRAGNVSEAMSLLKKAKLLERDLGNFESQEENFSKEPTRVQKVPTHQAASKSSPSKSESDENSNAINDAPRKTKWTIQRELLGLKKKALQLRREGRVDEAEEELKKGKILENQLEEMEKSPVNAKAKSVPAQSKAPHLTHDDLPIADNEKEDVTDQDMNDPAYLSLLKNLGWNDENNDLPNTASGTHGGSDSHSEHTSESVSQAEPVVPVLKPRRSKAEMQRELLGLKRKALALRRQGESEEADEVLKKAKDLETQIADAEQSAKEAQIEPNTRSENVEIGAEVVSENHIHDPSIISVHSVDTSVKKRSKGQIQKELLNLKRTALMHRRKGENEEAEEILRKAQVLEAQIEELEAPKMVQLQEVDHGIIDSDLHSLPVEDPIIPPRDNAADFIDLLTGDVGFQQPLEKKEPAVLRDEESSIARKDDFRTEIPEKIVHRDPKPRTEEAISTSENALQTKESALKQEITARKREAVALKRAGKLAEAKEELRQAKLLEKRLSEDDANSKTIPSREPVSENDPNSKSSPARDAVSQNVPSETTNPKPISSRERFKLQQKSLAHKRQALKLRKEGKTQEAEVEFELAKALEAQLEESSPARDSSSSYGEGDVNVEDFLDPQLLSALKAIGIDDSISFKSPKPDVSDGKSQNTETTSLEEQIKAEKLKALNLKRAGKQAEALDAFRRAKLLEKKLNSLS